MKKSELKRRLEKIEIDRLWWMERWADQRTANNDCEEYIQKLEEECQTLAGWLMSEWVTVHESKVADVDAILNPYLGTSNAQ